MRSPGGTLMRLSVGTWAVAQTTHCCWVSSHSETVSGVMLSNCSTACRALSRERASIHSARANKDITIAASGHSPIAKAPVTAILIKALILRLRFLMATQPFLYTCSPESKIATKDKASHSRLLPDHQLPNSATKAKTTATIILLRCCLTLAAPC